MRKTWNKTWNKTLKRAICYLLVTVMLFDSGFVSDALGTQTAAYAEENGQNGSVSGNGAAGQSTPDVSPTNDEQSGGEDTPDEPDDVDGPDAVPMLLAEEDEEEDTYVLSLGDQALDVVLTDNKIDFTKAVSVDYGTPLVFKLKKNGAAETDFEVYYATDLMYDGDRNIIVDTTNHIITEDTKPDAGDYYLFFSTDTYAEMGFANQDSAGAVKYFFRIDKAPLAPCETPGWGTGDESMCAAWDAVTKDANGRDLAEGAAVTYKVSLYYGEETEPFYTSDALTVTSLDLTDVIKRDVSEMENPGKGYGDYTFKVTASVNEAQAKNYTASTSAVSPAYHYSDTENPEIKSYQVVDNSSGKKLQGTAVDAGTGIAAYAFAPKGIAESALTWKRALNESGNAVAPGEIFAATASMDETGTGEIWFYVKDADDNIACQKVRLSEDGSEGEAVFLSRVTCHDYYSGNTKIDYEQYLVDGESFALPVVSATELVRTGYAFGGWYTDAQYMGAAAGTAITPGTTDGFHMGTAYDLYAKWDVQDIQFGQEPQDVGKVYDAKKSTLTATLEEGVTYDSISWNWYYKASAEAEPVQVDASRVSGSQGRSTTCSVEDVADSGIYYATATLTVGSDTRGPVSTKTATVAITKRTLRVKVADQTITYREEAPSTYTFEAGNHASDEGLVGGDTIESLFGGYASDITCTYKKGDPVTSDETKYQITYIGDTSSWNVPNYDISLTKTGYLTVEPLDLTDSEKLTATLSEAEFTYDGMAHKPAVTSLVLTSDGGEPIALVCGEDKDYTYDYQNNTAAEQTNTAVVVTFRGNYKGTYMIPFTIKKGSYTVKTIMAGWKYGDEASVPTVDTLKAGTPDYYYLQVGKDAEGNYLSDEEALAAFEREDFDSSAATDDKPVNAGKYYVWAVIPATDNYGQITAAPAVFTISRRQIIITPQSQSWPYDGNIHTAGSITSDQITGDGFVGEDDFLSIAVSGSIRDIGQVDVTVVPKLNTATNPDNYEIIVKPATLTITETKLATPSTFRWSSTPGTLSWIAITKDNLKVEYRVRLYRAKEQNGSICRDQYGNVLYDEEPVATATTDKTSYSFLDKILADSATDQYAYAATIQVVPVYGENEAHNFVESDASKKTALKYTAKVTLNMSEKGVRRAYIGETLAEDSTEPLTTSYVLLQGQSIALHMEPESGYTNGLSTWSVSGEQESFVSFSSTWMRNPVLTLVDNSSMSAPQEISVMVKAEDDYPNINRAEASAATDNTYVNVDLAFSDVLGLASYALVKGEKEDTVPGASGAEWKEIPKDEDGKAKTSYICREKLTKAGIYYVYVKDTSGNCSYCTTPVVVYQIFFDTGVSDGSVTGTMTPLIKLKDQAVTLPDIAFSKAGFGFTNWTGSTGIYANKGNYIANQSDTLTAGWTDEKVNYTVKYYYQKLTEMTGEGGQTQTALSYEEEAAISYDSAYGAVISYNKPEIQAPRTGYKLTETPAGVDGYQSSITATENGQTLCLYYDLEKYQVTYQYTDTDGSQKKLLQPYYYGQTVSENALPSAIGYTFVGWDWGDVGQAPVTMPNKNLTVTGYFQAEQTQYYIVYYKQNLDQSVSNKNNNYLAKSFEKDDALTEEISARFGDRLEAYLAEPATAAEDAETIVARDLTGFTPAAVRVCYGDPQTIDESGYAEWIDEKHTSDNGTVQKNLTAEELSAAPDYQNGPTYICFYYMRNIYNITLDVYKDARENNIHLFGSYYDGTSKTDYNGEIVTVDDGAHWKLPYGYQFADERAETNGDGTDGSYKASFFETYGYEPLESDTADAHSVAWTKRWPKTGTSKEKYYLATFVDWSTGERPTTMPAGDASVTREYASKELARYKIEVYVEELSDETQTVTLDDDTTQNVTLKTAQGGYKLATSYERYGNTGDTVKIVDAEPAEEDKISGCIYITVEDLMKGVSNYNQYEHNPLHDLHNTDPDDLQHEILEAVITENTVTDGVIGDVVTLRLNLVRKEYTTVVRYHKLSSVTDLNGNSTEQNQIFATRTLKAKWGTTYLADLLDLFDGSEKADGGNTVVGTEEAQSIAATDFRNGNYIVSYSGYYWLPNSGGHGPAKQYNTPTELNAAPTLVMTVGGSSNGTDNLNSNYTSADVTSPARSYMDIYYSAQEIDQHYYLKLQHEKCTADENDSSVIKETNTATNMVISSAAYPDLAEYGTDFQLCVANKCDVFKVSQESAGGGIPEAYQKYPGSYYLGQSSGAADGFRYSYQKDSEGKEILRDGTDNDNAFVEVQLTYTATEDRQDDSKRKEVSETGTFYIPGSKNGDTFTPYTYTENDKTYCLLFAVDDRNQFYNGNRISYNYDSSVSAHIGREVFMAQENYPTTGRVVEVENSTAMLKTNGKNYTETPLTDMNANVFQAYYYNVYNDYYLIFQYDGVQCSSCPGHTNYSYKQWVENFNCSHFSVAEGYFIAWYLDADHKKPVEPFQITGPTTIYGRKEKKPVENLDYAFYKLPETKTIGDKKYDWITTDNVAQITWEDRTGTTDESSDVTVDNVDNSAGITGQGQEKITKSVEVPYKNEYDVETTYKGLRTEWYVDGQLVMAKQPNYSMTYAEFTMDYTKYNRDGFRYDETNTKNKSKAFCSTTPVSMYAYFTRDSYTLTVTRNRTKSDNDEVTTRINGAKIRLEDPVKEGYTFKEWKLQEVTTDENGVNRYTDLDSAKYGYQHTDAAGNEAGFATFAMPICNTRALAVWEPAQLENFKITHYLQDDKQTYDPELLKTVQAVCDANVSGTIKGVSIRRDGEAEKKSATAYYETIGASAPVAISFAEGNLTYYYAGMELPGNESDAIEVEMANVFAVVQKVPDVKSEQKLSVKDYKLSGLGTMFEYAFTKYQQDTLQQTLGERTTDESGNPVDQTFAVYTDATVDYYYQRSSSIKIRAIGLAADGSASGLTLSGAGDHYYGEKVTLYATVQPNGYDFKGWFKASDVLQDYPADGNLPDSLDGYSLKSGILDLIGEGDDKIHPITTEKNLEMTVKASGDYVAITDAGSIGNPTLTVTSKREEGYVYNYENDTNNVLTASVNWGMGGAGANVIKKYTWYVKYIDDPTMNEEAVSELERTCADIPLTEMTPIENSDAGTYLFPTGQEAGYYVYRCVADIERKDNGRTGTAAGTCLVSVAQNRDYYETYPRTFDYDGAQHTFAEYYNYGTKMNPNIQIYYSKSAISENITDAELWRRRSLTTGDEQITTDITEFTDVAVDETKADRPVIAHTVYYYIRSTDKNYATIAGSEEVTINPVWLTVEAVRPFTKVYDASKEVQGEYGSKKADGTDSDFHRLQTGNDCNDDKGYYVLNGILDCDKGKTLYLDFKAEFDSMHVDDATVVTLSDMWVVQEAVDAVFENYNYRFPNGTQLQLSGQIKPYPLEIKWVPQQNSDPDDPYTEQDFVYRYDGTEKHPFVVLTDENIPDGKEKFSIKVNGGQKSVNTYDASAEVEAVEDAAYKPSDYTFTLETCRYRILPRYIKVAPKTMTKVYNGVQQTMQKTEAVDEFVFFTKETEEEAWREYEKLPEGETFSVQATGSGRDVGTYTIGAANLKILNEAGKNISDNYEIAYDTGRLTIAPCPVVVSGITAENKDYDGNTTATVHVDHAAFYPLQTDAAGQIVKDADGKAVQLTGLFSGDSLKLDENRVTGAFADAKAGADKKVTLTIDNSGTAENGSGGALFGDSKNNYKLVVEHSQKETTATISAGTILTVSVNDLKYTYGEQPDYADYVLQYKGFAPGDSVESAVNSDDANRAAFVIKKKNDAGEYETVVADGTAEDMKTLDAGTYYIFIETKTDGTVAGEAKGLHADNYTIVVSDTPGKLTVEKRPVAIEAKRGAAAITRVYDGTTDVEKDIVIKEDENGAPVYYAFTGVKSAADPSTEVAASGVVNGDKLTVGTYTAKYDFKDVVDASKIKVTNVKLTGDKAGNYTLANTDFDLVGSITTKDMTITVEN